MSTTYSGADARLQYLFQALEDKVSYTPALTTGTLVGTLTIDGTDYELYCTSGGGGGDISPWVVKDGMMQITFDDGR